MTLQKYSTKEALNRILRIMKGKSVPSDVPGEFPPSPLSEDEAISEIAELMAGSYPGESLFSDNQSGRYAQIYGEGATGTSQALTSGTWTGLTGFTNAGEYTDGLTPDPTNNRIFVTKSGTYLIEYGVSFTAVDGILTVMHFEANVGGTRYEQASFRRGIGASGNVVGNAYTGGILEIDAGTTGTSVSIDVQSQDADRILHAYEKRLLLLRIGK